MRYRFIAALALGLIATASTQAATLTPAQRMAKALEGRVAGKPVDCIQLNLVRSSQIIDKTAIIYDTGSTLYVNTPPNGAESLDSNEILITDTHTPQLCSIDVVHLVDNGSHFPRGFVGLGKFVPYTKPKQ